MPVGTLKNTLYGLALPLLGRRCGWKEAGDPALEKILHTHHVAGTCIQRFEKGSLADSYVVGWASEKSKVTEETLFRTASVAKMVTALLVFRLQTLDRLDVEMNVGELLGYPVWNPFWPDRPVSLGMLLSHTSSIVDSAAYYASFAKPSNLSDLLSDPAAFLADEPGTCFRYSNMAAGMIGCLLEKKFGMSFETLAQQELFKPLGIEATFDLSSVDPNRTASSYRVMPSGLSFDAAARAAAARPVSEPDPEHHYLLASGSLFITARDLARLTLLAWDGGEGFLDDRSLAQMRTPLLGWPQPQVCMRHGMGLFELDDASICSRKLWGHQGFAYGAVNGVFFDADGNGFVCLNSGASERRLGHLALLNRDLIRLWMNG